MELFFSRKKLDKTELRDNFAEYIKRLCSRRRGTQRQFVNSYSKTEQKMSKKETLTHALGLNEEESSNNSNNEEHESTNYQE